MQGDLITFKVSKTLCVITVILRRSGDIGLRGLSSHSEGSLFDHHSDLDANF
jgi:hypothetical protein